MDEPRCGNARRVRRERVIFSPTPRTSSATLFSHTDASFPDTETIIVLVVYATAQMFHNTTSACFFSAIRYTASRYADHLIRQESPSPEPPSAHRESCAKGRAPHSDKILSCACREEEF